MPDTEPPENRPRVLPITWVGLFVALFGMLLARQIVNYISADTTLTNAILKEAGMWLVAIVLIAIIRFGEGLPLSSVGLRASHLLKSILWGLLLSVICLAAAGVFVALTHFNGGKNAEAFGKLPVWLITATVVRAGVVEELCYRGYAIERLHALGLPRAAAAGIPLLIFGIAHWTGGWLSIGIALLLGAILAIFYIWKRDLLVNMIGHTLVDFVPNVLPKLLR